MLKNKQYAYRKQDVLAIINNVANTYGCDSLCWGNASAQEVSEIVERLSEKYGDPLEAPRLANEIRSLETGKLLGGANKCLNKVLLQLKKHRLTIIDGKLLEKTDY
ncbi:hypothetical protein [Aliivibrio fischeri]|uniref:hypothetical protein n=1 Tax=Aliivibrio fischeri TaxID=668 RepID=UPI0007C4618C|nr:hypothetical protein [Aliivibrio fischeri]